MNVLLKFKIFGGFTRSRPVRDSKARRPIILVASARLSSASFRHVVQHGVVSYYKQ